MRSSASIYALSFLILIFTSSAAAEDPITIGLMGTYSGDSATPGLNCRDGFEVARKLFAPNDRLGARILRFVYGDTKGQPTIAVSEFQRLESIEHAAAIINQRSQTSAAINPLALKAGIPLIAIAGQSNILSSNPNTFRFWPSAKTEAEKLAELFSRWKSAKVAIVSAEEEYTLSLAKELKSHLTAQNKSPIYDVTVLPADTDFSSIISNLRSLAPDLVICNLTIPQNGTFVKKLRELGVRTRVIGNYWVSLPDFLTTTGPAFAEGVTVAAINPDKTWLKQAFIQAGNTSQPTAVAATCLTALAGLLTAAGELKDEDLRIGITKNLHRLTEVKLPGETIPLENREAIFPLETLCFRNGVLEPL